MKPRGRGKGHMVYQTNQLSSVRQVRASVVEGYNPPRVIRRRGLCLVERDSQPRKYELVVTVDGPGAGVHALNIT